MEIALIRCTEQTETGKVMHWWHKSSVEAHYKLIEIIFYEKDGLREGMSSEKRALCGALFSALQCVVEG